MYILHILILLQLKISVNNEDMKIFLNCYLDLIWPSYCPFLFLTTFINTGKNVGNIMVILTAYTAYTHCILFVSSLFISNEIYRKKSREVNEEDLDFAVVPC